MSKTNTGLVEYAKHFVGYPYWFGCYGQTGSASLYNQMSAIYPSYYTTSNYSEQYGKKVHDCSGLIKGYLWSDTLDGTPAYNAAQDYNAQMLYNSAAESGTISSIPAVAGVLVFKGSSASKITHVGVYDGGNYVYEAKGHSYGVVKTTFIPKEWKYWGKCCFVSYDDDANSTPMEIVATHFPQSYDKKYSHYYTVATKSDNLNVRDGSSTAYSVMVSIPKGMQVRCWGYYDKLNSGAIWLYVTFTYNDNSYVGFASIDYLQEVAE